MENNDTSNLAICIVLDRSGSMESCQTDAVGAINSYLRQARNDADMAQANVSLIIFDSQSIDTLRDNVPIATCPDLTEDEYQPRAMTPLLDAVAQGVARLEEATEKEARRILVVMTDGLENASREHTNESLSALLKRKHDAGWLIVYLGADHDAWSQASSMGFSQANCSQFSKKKMKSVAYALGARSQRYAKSEDALQAALSGFSEEERSSMRDDE